MMPALHMIASSGPVFFTAATQARTDEGSASSHAAGAVSPFTEAHAAAAVSRERAVPITAAPLEASTRMVS